MLERIGLDDDGAPDDVVFKDAKMVHIERMDDGRIWMGIYAYGNAGRYVVNFTTPRNSRLNWTVEEDW
jgi:hypothetical protein